MSAPIYLKVVSKDNEACHGGSFDYAPHLPTESGPGLALPFRAPDLCNSGWHWCTPETLMSRWAKADMRVYTAQPSADVTGIDNDGKCVSSGGQLLAEYPTPGWWQASMTFIAELPSIPWCQPDGDPDPTWRLFTAPTLAAAWDAAGAAARAAAWDAAWAAAWAAAWDAALYTGTHHILEGIELDQTHRDTAAARWNAWTKGYCVLGDVDGALCVYAKELPA